MSLLFIKAHLLNPASRNVHNILLSWESLCNITNLLFASCDVHKIPLPRKVM